MKNIKNYFGMNRILKLKIIGALVMLILILGFMMNIIYLNIPIGECLFENYKDKLIRFHVLANSDLEEDQKLKLKVRDAVIDYLQPKLVNSKDVSESEFIILEQREKIKELCERIIKQNGYDYGVKVNLGYSNFPAKQYSSVVLPAGEYKALKIIIGKGEGRNWWCVMFPPLCFIDEENNVIDKETDDKLKEILTEQEYKLIVEKDNNKIDNLKIKFKIVEVFQNIVNFNKK